MKSRPTIEEQIKAVEGLLENLRWARFKEVPERAVHCALKQIAGDLRGRLPDSVSRSVKAIQNKIDVADRHRTSLGYEKGDLIVLGQELIGRWPTIRRALEQYEDQQLDDRMPSTTDLPF